MSITAALVVAAGRGQRMEGAVPKQYRQLGALPVLRHTIDQLLRHARIDLVQAVIHPDDLDLYNDAVQGLELPAPVIGGAARQESVWLGLEALAGGEPRHVLIHDGVRPFLSATVVDHVLAGLERAPAVIPAVQITDTIKRVDLEGRVTATVDRNALWCVQTPQGFAFEAILAAHRAAHREDPLQHQATDDAQIAETAGLDVLVVQGDIENFKITREIDLVRAERLVRAGQLETRVGLGFAAHAFGPGDHVMICGLPVPHEHGMRGDLEVDVALDAVVDALNGAVAADAADGGIGASHAAADDPPRRAGPTELSVRNAVARLAAQGGRIVNVDVTIICERPKITPWRERMQARLATLLGVPPARIGIKATTTEGLGFAGRREGIGAQATAAVEVPTR